MSATLATAHTLLTQLHQLQATYPVVATGQSANKHPLFAWRVGKAKNDYNSAIHTMVIGAFHGDEPESAQLTTHWLKQQLTDPTPNLPPTLCIPVLNPDGLLANTRHNANGIDLNRNWPTKNFDKNTPATDPYYGGHTPASEPETQWLIDIIGTYQPTQILSLHTPYRVVNYDGPATAWAEHLSAQLPDYPVTTDIGYPTPGSFGTYYGVERQRPVITLELVEQPLAELAPTHSPAISAACLFGYTP